MCSIFEELGKELLEALGSAEHRLNDIDLKSRKISWSQEIFQNNKGVASKKKFVLM